MNSSNLASIDEGRSSNLGRLQYFVYVTLIIYFIVPHHLFTVLLNHSAVKPFDLAVLISVCFFLICKINLKGYLPILCLFGIYFLRSIIASSEVGLISIVYALKIFEYFIVIFCIKDLRQIFINRLLKIYILTIFVYILAELLGFNVGLLWGDRATGHFGGPYELSAVALLFIFFLNKNFSLKILFVFIIFLTGTKASYLALLFGLLLFSNIRNLIPITIIGFGFIVLINSYDERFFEFITNLANIDINFIISVWDSLPKIESHYEYMDQFNTRELNADEAIDLSSFSRLYTYAIILKSFDLYSLIFGHGPGFFGTAVDSSILRVIAEVGILGFLPFLYIFINITNNFESKSKNLLLILSIIALSDVFFSARFLTTLALLNQYRFYQLKAKTPHK